MPADCASGSLPFEMCKLIMACDGGRILHTRSSVDSQFDDSKLFTWNDVFGLARTDTHADRQWRLYKSGQSIDPKMMGALDDAGQLRPDRLASLIEQGVSVMINRLELKVAHIGRLARKIESQTGAYVRVVAIASPGRAPCMPLHYDHVDVIAIQTDGVKTWFFYGQPVEGCGIARKLEYIPEAVTEEATLRSGDRLFVPAGLHHQCQPSDRSLHLALNLKWPTVKDLYPDLVEGRPQDLALLEPIRAFTQSDRVESLLDQLAEFDHQTPDREQITEFLADWPRYCGERYRVADIGEYY